MTDSFTILRSRKANILRSWVRLAHHEPSSDFLEQLYISRSKYHTAGTDMKVTHQRLLFQHNGSWEGINMLRRDRRSKRHLGKKIIQKKLSKTSIRCSYQVNRIKRVFRWWSLWEHLSLALSILVRCKGRYHEPTRAKMCHANSLTLSTSVVIRVIIWALLEKLSSSFSGVSVSAFPFSLTFDEGGGGAEEATSFRTRVFANKTEFSWILSRTWTLVVDSDQSCPVTVVINQYLCGRL